MDLLQSKTLFDQLADEPPALGDYVRQLVNSHPALGNHVRQVVNDLPAPGAHIGKLENELNTQWIIKECFSRVISA